MNAGDGARMPPLIAGAAGGKAKKLGWSQFRARISGARRTAKKRIYS
jgi:hypothetical protein